MIEDIRITGDFFLYPEDSILELENSLRNVKYDRDEVYKVLKEFFLKVKAPFVTPEDFLEAIIGEGETSQS